MDLMKSFHSPFFKTKSSSSSPPFTSNSDFTPTKPKLFRKNTLRKRSISPPHSSPISTTTSSSSKTYFTYTTNEMGQQNSKPDSNHITNEITHHRYPNLPQPCSTFSSPGPDPFHHSLPPSRVITSPPPAPAPPIPIPAFYHAPHSAPVVPVSIKPKGLIRSLSAKRRGESRRSNHQNQIGENCNGSFVEPELPPLGNIKALKTLGQYDLKSSIKEFEFLVQKAEIDAGLRSSSPDNSILGRKKSSTLPTKSLKSIKRSSINNKDIFTFTDNSPLPKLVATPAYLRPTPYRRNSCNSSIHSSRVSIKSAKRAEREWRAKVSALSSGLSPSNSNSPSTTYNHISPKAPLRIKGGPVPPKRRFNMSSALSNSQTSRSPSPHDTEEGTIIITPPHSNSTNFSTPLSNKSFETLGHYPNSSTIIESPTPASSTNDYDLDSEIRERKPSVPHSAYSSVYSTLKNEDGLARPISFASGQWLAPVNSSPLKIQITTDQNQEEEDGLFSPISVSANGVPTPVPDSPHEEKLPPFESFKSSPRMVGSTLLPNVNISKDDRVSHYDDDDEREIKERDEIHKKHQSLPSPPRPTALQSRRPSLHIPSLQIPTSPPTLPPLASIAPLSAPSSPGLVTPTKPIFDTPVKSSGYEEPSTPYSPTTAYIMSAPSPSIDQLAFSTSYGAYVPSPPIKKVRSEEDGNGNEPITPVRKHPFTFGAKPSPEVVISMKRGSSEESTGQSSDIVPHRSNNGYPTKPLPSSTNTGISIIPRRSSIDPFIPRQLPSTILPRSNPNEQHPNALRPRNQLQNIPTSIKSNIIGNSNNIKEPGLKRLGKNKIDLTPGMENGCRPPKSGLPMADLERWLQGTSI